ncbi:MAG: Na(+)/H(+) antiporter subunit D [Acidobacteriota bacterium]
MLALPPGWPLILGGLLLALLRRPAFAYATLALPILSYWHFSSLPDAYTYDLDLFWYKLELIKVDRLSRIFGLVFHIAALLGALFALHVRDRVQHVSAMVYAGATIAATAAGDLISLFIFWEMTAISSVFLIWARRTPRAVRTGLRYLVIQVGSGVLLLSGTLLYLAENGEMTLKAFTLDGPATWLIFLAFGIKAAFPLLHNWLQDAYPESTATGTVFLSGFTTKLAIYALARCFPGTELLIPIGVVMTLFPIFYAEIENDLRKVLAYSLNNQLGYMVVGIGIGTELALNGAAAHAFVHIIYKGLLFMAMGAVLYRTGTTRASELGGLYKAMPWTTAFCIVGAVSISAFPLFSGFVAKGMILTAVAEEHRTLTFLGLLFASAGVMHHSGIKIPYFAFFAHDHGIRHRRKVREAPWNMLGAMALASALCIGIGVLPGLLYVQLPFSLAAAEYLPYTATHVVTQLQLLLLAALAFAVLMRMGLYPDEVRSINVDSDWTYRKVAPAVLRGLERGFMATRGAVERSVSVLRIRMMGQFGHLYGPRGWLGSPWSTGETALWSAILLVAYLVLSYYVD